LLLQAAAAVRRPQEMLAAAAVRVECVHLRKLSPAQTYTPLQLVLEEQQEILQTDRPVQSALLIQQVLLAAAAVAGLFLKV
jgi:hypothetical protein